MMEFLFMAISYLMGSVNNAIIICKTLGLDIRQLGSGNPGTMNMIRSLGLHWGLLTLILDAVKGILPALLGWYFLGEEVMEFGADKMGLYLCALAGIIGHMFPIYYQFKGGKGVASTLGVCMLFNPLVTGISFVILVLIMVFTKIGFIASFIGVGIPLVWQAVVEFIEFGSGSGDIVNLINGFVLLVIYGAVIYMHRGNIVRFVHGKENKIVLFGKNKSAKLNREKVVLQKDLRRQMKAEKLALKNNKNENNDQ